MTGYYKCHMIVHCYSIWRVHMHVTHILSILCLLCMQQVQQPHVKQNLLAPVCPPWRNTHTGFRIYQYCYYKVRWKTRAKKTYHVRLSSAWQYLFLADSGRQCPPSIYESTTCFQHGMISARCNLSVGVKCGVKLKWGDCLPVPILWGKNS